MTEQRNKVIVSYGQWIKTVTGSLSAFLGVLFALGSRNTAEDMPLMYGSVCAGTILSVLLGFLILAIEPLLTATSFELSGKDNGSLALWLIKIGIILTIIWSVVILITFLLMFSYVVSKYILK